MATIYSARCVSCGHIMHDTTRIQDGTKREHEAFSYDSEGLTVSRVCRGVFVSLMGRTREEIDSVSAEWRRRRAVDGIIEAAITTSLNLTTGYTIHVAHITAEDIATAGARFDFQDAFAPLAEGVWDADPAGTEYRGTLGGRTWCVFLDAEWERGEIDWDRETESVDYERVGRHRAPRAQRGP